MNADQPLSEDHYKQLLNDHDRICQDIKVKLTQHSTAKSGTFERLTTSKSNFLKAISHAESVSKPQDSNEEDGKSKDSEGCELDSDDDDEDMVPYDMSHYSEYKKVWGRTYDKFS